ncbi:hypothetical protein K1719_023753 [Acacia pycnantha]|nr:hypothetical protein K1719_023753 [Acacia pycnantha]
MVVSKAENTLLDSKKSELPGYAVLNTSKGSIIIDLYKDTSPEVVDEFIDLCQKGHFKGMHFHHVGSIDSVSSHRFSIKGRVYPAILPVEDKKVTGRVYNIPD